MNQEVLDYISAQCDTVSRMWDVGSVFMELARGGQKILVSGSERWKDRVRDDIREGIRNHRVEATVRSQRRTQIVFNDESEIDFISSHAAPHFAGHHWDVAFLESFMARQTNEPGSMPVWRIPAQADWNDLSDAGEDALEFLRTHQGEVEFDFRGNRYKVPYGCDYCVMVGSIFPSYDYHQPFSFGFTGWHEAPTVSNTYAGISRSPAPQIAEAAMRQAIAAQAAAQAATMMALPSAAGLQQQSEGAMQQLIENSRQRLYDEIYRASPAFDSLGMVHWSSSDPLEFPTPQDMNTPFRSPIQYAHLSEVGHIDVPTARELDLQRRLDTVRECFASMPNPLVLRDRESAQRLMEALAYPAAPVQHLDSYVYRYEFVNGQALKVNDKLECGTILDAAARPVRKFRLVEE